MRDGYLEALDEYLTEVRRGCTRIGIDYHLVRTGDYLDAVLTKFLHHRMDDRATPAAAAGARARSKKQRALKVSGNGIRQSVVYGGRRRLGQPHPILIHLINRMRFKRVRWAAMEFLLKSQKRNRRKLIIEQLILLALRCLLVLLVGLLLGRLRFGGDTGQNAFHFVVLDDTPSMGDHFVENGKAIELLRRGQGSVETAGRHHRPGQHAASKCALCCSPTWTMWFSTSNSTTAPATNWPPSCKTSGRPRFTSIPSRPSRRRGRFSRRCRAARRYFHFVSDFRERDWKTGPDAEALAKAVDGLTAIGAHVSYIDTAHRFRGASEEGIAAARQSRH